MYDDFHNVLLNDIQLLINQHDLHRLKVCFERSHERSLARVALEAPGGKRDDLPGEIGTFMDDQKEGHNFKVWRKAFEYRSEGLDALYTLIEEHFFDEDGNPIYDKSAWPVKKNLASAWLSGRRLKEADAIITSGKRTGNAKK